MLCLRADRLSSLFMNSWENLTLPFSSVMPFSPKAWPRDFKSSVRTALFSAFSVPERVIAENLPEYSPLLTTLPPSTWHRVFRYGLEIAEALKSRSVEVCHDDLLCTITRS